MPRTLGVLIFPDFELLDACGPLEMFGTLPDDFTPLIIAEKKGPVRSFQKVEVQANYDFNSAPQLDLLLIPGGMGTRTEVNNQKLLDWLKERAKQVSLLLSVCTGSALLAKSGLLDKRKATSNKVAFKWVKQQGPNVNWVDKARWVDDGNIITSSGVAAGIDMSLHVINRLLGSEKANYVANETEYVPNQDPTIDPFFKP